MATTYIKTTAGKLYSALCANACTIKSEEGILIKEIEANKQDYFVAPEAYIQTDDAGLLLTECFNEAPIGLVAIGGINESIDNITTNLGGAQTQLEELESTLNQLTTETIPDIEASIDGLEENYQELSEQLSAQQESLATLSGRLDSLSTQLTTNIASLTSSIASIKCYPNWTNAVPLSVASTGISYSAPSTGWICGWGWASSASLAGFYINGVQVASDAEYIGNLQVLVSAGDVLTISSWAGGSLYFVPCQ